MDEDPRSGSDQAFAGGEPITLSDPDGSLTRVAPWSTWTREQVRAPGGESKLVTHLLSGQLWFAAGRTRSPWQHEVKVGDISVSTPKGRFRVTAAVGGGATVYCLAGMTRVVVGSRDPLILEENQAVAVSSDDSSILVSDAPPAVHSDAAPLSGYDDETTITFEPTDDSILPVPYERRRGAAGILAVAAAVVAVVAVVVAALTTFVHDDDGQAAVTKPDITETTDTDRSSVPSTNVAPVTTSVVATTVPTTRTSTSVASTSPPQTTSPATIAAVRSSPDAKAVGDLTGCRRAGSGVLAVVDVAHRSGGPGRFRVDVRVVDRGGREIGTGSGDTPLIVAAEVVRVEVDIPLAASSTGSCELVGVTLF